MSASLEAPHKHSIVPRRNWHTWIRDPEERASIRLAEKIKAAGLDLSELRSVAATDSATEDWMLSRWPILHLLVAEARAEYDPSVNPDVWWAVWHAYYGGDVELTHGRWLRVECRA